ncbi:hypothetical protein P4O66_002120 [Electrophorus voltai]|uniref:Alkylated DNA repair protein AlkB homologue 8 N-terminal domain-containing protein n=1 Tax=Electrophorus voltai TaxID=2609070 RepID=A0AAD8Z1S7_9TELE|nr:hypothetical protein P4O66_002120 [Electrophorus voltai]
METDENPEVPSALEQFRGTLVFTKLDLRSAYNLLQGKLTSATILRFADFTLPFSVESNARIPGECGCILLYSLYTYDCAATSSSTIIIKFADDIIVMGLILDKDDNSLAKKARQRLNHLRRLRDFRLPSKKVCFLGHEISAQGIGTDPGKGEAVKSKKVPSTVLGFL